MQYARALGLLVSGLLVAGASTAQIKYADFRYEAGDCGDHFGSSVATYGGLALVGAPSDGWCGDDQGVAILLDLDTGENLAVLEPSTISGYRFGQAVGLSAEYMVVCGWSGTLVYDTATSQLLHTLDQPASDVAVFGSLAVLGSPYESCGSEADCGAAYVYDLATGQELHRLTAPFPFQWDEFGRSVAIHGSRVAVGTQGWEDPGYGFSGKVHVFDVGTGQHLYELSSSVPTGQVQDEFGSEVALRGNRLLVGAPLEWEAGIGNVGAVYVYDAQTGQKQGKIPSPNPTGSGGFFGTDINMSDGRVLITDPTWPHYSVYVIDVETRQVLDSADADDLGVSTDSFARGLAFQENRALVSDITDGQQEIGMVSAFLFEPQVGTIYCSPAVPNSTGMPARIRTHGSEVAQDDLLLLTADRLPPSQFGYFLTGPTQGFVANPGGSKGNLCLAGTIGRYRDELFNSGTAGSHSLFLDLSQVPFPGGNHAIQAGDTWNWTCWYRDNDPSSTSNFTDAVSILFQ